MSLLKVLFIIPHVLVFVSPIIFTSAFQKSTHMFTLDGSSTIYPVIKDLMSLTKKHKVSIQNSGTNSGVVNTLQHPENFIALSSQKSEHWSSNDKYKQKWTDLKMKTITLAKDAIFLLYQKPQGCSDELILDKEKFKTIYSIFTNHKHSNSVKNSYKDLVNSSNSACDKPIISFARNGGAKKSGTAYSFVYSNPWFNQLQSDTSNKSWTDKIIDSSIGNWPENKKYLKFTQENNKLSYENFDLEPSTDTAKMIYLSGAFVLENLDQIKSKQYHIASIKKFSTTKPQSNEIISINKTNFKDQLENYGWIRELNIIYSEKHLSNNKKELIQHIVNNRTKLEKMWLLPDKKSVTV